MNHASGDASPILEVASDTKAKEALFSLADDEDAKLLLLIQRTHSDTRPDPLYPNNYYTFEEDEAVAWIDTDGRNNAAWDMSYVDDFVEYFQEKNEDGVDLEEYGLTEDRLQEIQEGAEPTSHERALYREMMIEKADNASYPAGLHICRITAPEDSDEPRSIYFTWEGNIYDPNYAGEYTGPWRNIEEVLEYLGKSYKNLYCVHCCLHGEIPFEEEKTLDAWLARKQNDDDTRFAVWLKTQE